MEIPDGKYKFLCFTDTTFTGNKGDKCENVKTEESLYESYRNSKKN